MDINRYPYLENRDDGIPYSESPDETMDTQVPEGWKLRFVAMCNDINDILNEHNIPLACFHFDQIKEKFGALRCYWHVEYPDWMCLPEMDAPQEALCEVIDAAENDTSATCCVCGNRAKWHSKGWVLPFCDRCARLRNNEQNARHKTKYSVRQTFTKIRFDD